MNVKKAILKIDENIKASLYISSFNWETIQSGKEVKENDKLYFEIENLEGKKIEKWLVNGKELLTRGDVFLRYTVLAEDMIEKNGENVLERTFLSFETKEGGKVMTWFVNGKIKEKEILHPFCYIVKLEQAEEKNGEKVISIFSEENE